MVNRADAKNYFIITDLCYSFNKQYFINTDQINSLIEFESIIKKHWLDNLYKPKVKIKNRCCNKLIKTQSKANKEERLLKKSEFKSMNQIMYIRC